MNSRAALDGRLPSSANTIISGAAYLMPAHHAAGCDDQVARGAAAQK